MELKHRHVYRTDNVEQARRAMHMAIEDGLPADDIYLVARPDIEMHSISNRRKMADSDFVPAAIRGALIGSGIGLIVATVALLVWSGPPLALLLGAGLGAALGALAASLVGAALQDPVRRRFHREIAAGSVLVVVDAKDAAFAHAEQALQSVGAAPLPYDAPAAMS